MFKSIFLLHTILNEEIFAHISHCGKNNQSNRKKKCHKEDMSTKLKGNESAQQEGKSTWEKEDKREWHYGGER